MYNLSDIKQLEIEDETESPVESNEDEERKAALEVEPPKKTSARKMTDGQKPSDASEDDLTATSTEKKPTSTKDLAALRDKIKVKLRKFKRI